MLQGARGRQPADIEALATLLVRLGDFAVANAGRFRALDLNPDHREILRRRRVAVDIAVERSGGDAPTAASAANMRLRKANREGEQ